ncbi:SIS domain-containing protein [Phytohalomonas tamaricis]|uniref:SIS domain-containing protein n=1 Tax=Phytohalomonas tamaricis TaxID=2081032 RepID=UPI000D0BD399|nr:SIS domain-containing protein [Phytohalomonas tamaricis]
MTTRMLEEAISAPARIVEQLELNREPLEALAAELRQDAPRGVVTVARGSSDHAAGYFAYLCMARMGLPVASLPLSLTTLAHTSWRLEGQLALAVSQSGQSPDLIDTQRALKHGGARTLAMVNAPKSPLAQVSDREIALRAGEERSVAATKSYLATLSASAQLVAVWSHDSALAQALNALPEQLERAARLDWSHAVATLSCVDRLLVVGRGAGLAVAQEAALKFKETCMIQAEAFSAAEIKHGPMALVDRDYPVLIFAPPGAEQAGMIELAEEFRARGAHVLLAADSNIANRDLPLVTADHALLNPLCVIQTFYVMVDALAAALGLDPDTPRHLNKVTRTR